MMQDVVPVVFMQTLQILLFQSLIDNIMSILENGRK